MNLDELDFRHKTKEEIDNYQKQFLSDLYQKMLDDKFVGHITLQDDCLMRELPNGILYKIYLNLVIQEGYIEALYHSGNQEKSLTHWHPSLDEIYKDLLSINTGNIFWVMKKKRFFKELPMMIERQQWEKLSEKKRKQYEIL